jgi:hypothetical protein
MQHRNALTAALVVTLLIAVTVLFARDRIVTSGEADTGAAAVSATATEMPLVNLVQTTDGRQVAVPAGSLDQQGYEDDDDEDHDEEDDDHEDEDHEEEDDD